MITRLVTGLAVFMLARRPRWMLRTGHHSRHHDARAPRVERGLDISNTRDAVRGACTSHRRQRPDCRALGSQLAGLVVDAKEVGKVKGRGRISVRFTSLTSARTDDDYRISTRTWTKVAPSGKRRTPRQSRCQQLAAPSSAR
jgi:hypothetical protein